MTATDINEKLWVEFANFEYRLYNVFVFQNESDFFAVPEGLVTKDEIPPYAGLIYVNKKGCYFVRQPKFLHKENLFDNKKFLKQLLNKFYYRHMDLRNALEAREWEIQYKQKRIEFHNW